MIDFYFFPFTFIDARQVKVLSCFFEQLNVLDIHGGDVLPEPMAGLEAQKQLVRVCLDREKLGLAEQQVRSYLDWAAIHKGNERNLTALIREKVFFKDDSGLAAIQAGILKGATAPQKPCTPTVDSSKEALVFLKLADIHDREQQAIQTALDALDQENAALFAELKGDEDISLAADHADAPEPGQTMTEKRIKAWFKAAVDSQCFDKGGIPVLVTTSRAVMDEILAGAGKQINALDIDSIKVHENGCEFMAHQHLKVKAILEQVAKGVLPDAVEDDGQSHVTGRIKICFLSGLDGVNVTDKNPGGQIGVCLVQ